MSPRCAYIIPLKGRQCLNHSLSNNKYCHKHKNVIQTGGAVKEKPYISPYVMISSQLPPNPAQQSWYHHQAPVYQSFGDYICIKKDFLLNAKNLINDVLINVKH